MVQPPLQQVVHQQPPPQPRQVKKRRKKKIAKSCGVGSWGAAAPAPTMGQPAPVPMGQPPMVANSESTLIPVQAAAVVPIPDAPVVKQKKVGRCWKCTMNTHATKDHKVIHYCLVCDSGAHPTIRCPILKSSRPTSFFVGCGNDATLDLQLPNSVYKPQLISSGAPTTLVQVSGEGSVTAADIQSLFFKRRLWGKKAPQHFIE
jgi:hypothetical protein